MKTNYSSPMVYDVMTACLAWINKCATLDRESGCRTVLVQCENCGCVFSEEVRVAKMKVTCGESFICLSCDEEATAPAFVGITVQVGWWSDE